MHLRERESIPWQKIITEAGPRTDEEAYFRAFTDTAIKLALKEREKEKCDHALLQLGMEACLIRSKFAEALEISNGIESVEVLSLRAVALSVISDAQGLAKVFTIMEKLVNEESSPSDQIRLATTKVFLAAAERDTSVIICFMEFDNLLDTYPDQVENPLTETMYTLYVVGNLLNIIGQMHRAERIAESLEEMAKSRGHRLFLALAENLLGTTHGLLGDYAKAEEHFQRLYELSKLLSFKLGIAVAMNNLGKIKLGLIELEEAFNYFLRAYEMMDMDAHKLYCLTNLGEISFLLGHPISALEYLEKAIQIDMLVGLGLVETYALKAIVHSRIGEQETAWGILRIAMQLAESSEKPKERVAVLHAKGVLMAGENKILQANDALQDALTIAKDNELLEWLIQIELEIVRINIGEFERTTEKSYLTLAEYHLENTIQIATEQELHALYMECLILRCETRLYRGKLFEAKGDLERAIVVARRLNNVEMERIISQRLEMLNVTREGGIQLRPELTSLIMDRLSAFRPMEHPREIPQPEIHSLIVIGRFSGLPEFVHHFDDMLKLDSSLLSGFISVITSFSDEVLGKSGLLRSINQEGFTLMLEHTPNRIVILVANQETFDIRFKLHKFAQMFESTYPQSSETIRPKDYMAAKALIEEVFLKKDEPSDFQF